MGLRSRIFALVYDRMMASTERAGLADVRSRLVPVATGSVLEVGAGTGANLALYGAGAHELTVTEPEPAMLRRLERATERTARPVTVLRAPAEDLPFDSDTFDTVVCTLVLCGVDDQPRAARELHRVLKPGGRLLFIEHVRSDEPDLARHQDRFDWLCRATAGCHCNRPTRHTLEQAGFVFDDIVDGELPKAPTFTRPMITGRATKVDALVPG